MEVQRECGFECDLFCFPSSEPRSIARFGMSILLSKARSPSLSFGDYARKKQSEFEIECESVIKLDSPPV